MRNVLYLLNSGGVLVLYVSNVSEDAVGGFFMFFICLCELQNSGNLEQLLRIYSNSNQSHWRRTPYRMCIIQSGYLT